MATFIEKHQSILGIDTLLLDADDVHSTIDAMHTGLMQPAIRSSVTP